jgi:hypothetical protein
MPTIQGIIDRRILINYIAEPEHVAKFLPNPFRPRVYKGKAVVGICLIRLKEMRPKGFPKFMGVTSENGAHRIAVEWDENGRKQQGVYIPRRDTNLKLNSLVGGRLFPGVHYLAKFNVIEQNNHYHLDFQSSDGTAIEIDATPGNNFDKNSIFETLEDVSGFFEKGNVGYSPNGDNFDGLKLDVFHWKVEPLNVEKVTSSFFENMQIFPKGSIKFDNALLMKSIEHEWKPLQTIKQQC